MRGLVDGEALDVFIRHGPLGKPPGVWVFTTAVDETAWRRALGHQTRLRVSAADALIAVRGAWAAAGGP